MRRATPAQCPRTFNRADIEESFPDLRNGVILDCLAAGALVDGALTVTFAGLVRHTE